MIPDRNVGEFFLRKSEKIYHFLSFWLYGGEWRGGKWWWIFIFGGEWWRLSFFSVEMLGKSRFFHEKNIKKMNILGLFFYYSCITMWLIVAESGLMWWKYTIKVEKW